MCDTIYNSIERCVPILVFSNMLSDELVCVVEILMKEWQLARPIVVPSQHCG